LIIAPSKLKLLSIKGNGYFMLATIFVKVNGFGASLYVEINCYSSYLT